MSFSEELHLTIRHFHHWFGYSKGFYFGGRELLLGFRIWHSCPPELAFSTSFSKDCQGGESLETTTCLKTVVGVCKGIAVTTILSPVTSQILTLFRPCLVFVSSCMISIKFD